MEYRLFILLALFIISTPTLSQPGVQVNKKDYGDDWPFTVNSGTVDCVKGSAAIFITEKEHYQINGIASSLGYAPINPIWRDNPKIPGTKIDLSEMVDLALKQCAK